MRYFHNQAMMKQQIYDNILMKRSEMHYSPIIHSETSLVNTDEEKALTMSNQPEKSNQKQQKWCRCGSIKHLRVTSKNCPVEVEIRKSKTLALKMGISQAEANKAAEDSAE